MVIKIVIVRYRHIKAFPIRKFPFGNSQVGVPSWEFPVGNPQLGIPFRSSFKHFLRNAKALATQAGLKAGLKPS